jgi:hypothetical protein
LKGKRVTQDEINQIKENNDIIMKLIKLEGPKKEEELDDESPEKE